LAEEVLRDYQCRFTQNRSTTDQIFIIKPLFQKNCEYIKEFHVVFVDFQKVYDSIDRPSMDEILKHFHFPRKIVHLIETSIKHIKVKVKVGNSISRMMEVRTTLRQGNVLSPILFNLILEKVIREMKIDRDGKIIMNRTYFSLLAYTDDI